MHVADVNAMAAKWVSSEAVRPTAQLCFETFVQKRQLDIVFALKLVQRAIHHAPSLCGVLMRCMDVYA